MIELKLWVLTGIVAAIIPTLIFFLNRWIKQQETLSNVVDNLNKAIMELRLSIMEIKYWSNEKFVSENDFCRITDELRKMIYEFHDRLDGLTLKKGGN